MSELEDIIKQHHGHTSGFSLHYLTLYSIVLGMEAKNVLELGAGFSTVTILKALEKSGGSLITCDMRNIEDTGNDKSLINENRNWQYVQGDTSSTLKQIRGPFDVVLHDGSHEWKVVYKDLRNIIPKMRKGGIILVHDTEHKAFRLKLAVMLATLFCRHEKITLPYGYGLTIVRIKGDFGNGSVNLTWQKKR